MITRTVFKWGLLIVSFCCGVWKLCDVQITWPLTHSSLNCDLNLHSWRPILCYSQVYHQDLYVLVLIIIKSVREGIDLNMNEGSRENNYWRLCTAHIYRLFYVDVEGDRTCVVNVRSILNISRKFCRMRQLTWGYIGTFVGSSQFICHSKIWGIRDFSVLRICYNSRYKCQIGV